MAFFAVSSFADPLVLTGQISGSPEITYYPPDEGAAFLGYEDPISSLPASIPTEGADGTFDVYLYAPEGQRVTVAPVDGGTLFGYDIRYSSSTSAGLEFEGSPTITFFDLEGPAPQTVGNNYSGFYSTGPVLGFYWYVGSGESFSFSGMKISYTLSGTAVATTLTLSADHPNLFLQDQSYTGDAPPDNPALYQVAAVPEPTVPGLLGIAALGGLLRRRRAARAA